MQRIELPTRLRGGQEARVETDGLPILQAGGFSASVDAFAWEPDPDLAARRMRLWFLSVLGPQESVKALWARLVKGEVATLSFEHLGNAHFCTLAPEGPRAWRFYTANLRPSAERGRPGAWGTVREWIVFGDEEGGRGIGTCRAAR